MPNILFSTERKYLSEGGKEQCDVTLYSFYYQKLESWTWVYNDPPVLMGV